MVDKDLGKNGLSSSEASQRLKQYGPNVLPEKPPSSSFLIFLDQFKSPLVYILFLAAGVTLFLRDFPDMAIILLAVFLNTVLGFYQERKAKLALHALSKILTPQAKVIRDGEKKVVDARALVPGDLVVLETGDKIPADGMVMEAVDLSINEAILTGESQTVRKKSQEQGFMGTIVTSGRGLMEVTHTGRLTKMGEIAGKLQKKEEKTPLEKRLVSLARFLAVLVGAAALFIFLSGVIVGKGGVEMFTVAVALAVAAIPEGLVVSLTVILAIGMQRILRRKALVRNLASAETLGSVTVICADKTGTLTEGIMRVVKDDFLDRELGIKAAVLCNNLHDPLEYAMWEWAEKNLKFKIENLKLEYPRLGEIPFSSQTKLIATLHPGFLFVSGAPEVVLKKCKIENLKFKIWEKKFEEYGQEGLRMVGFAYKNIRYQASSIQQKDLQDLSWLGLLLFEDPVRPSVAQTLKECREARIKVKIITGDYLQTSLAVLEKLGMKLKKDEVIEGEELRKISKEELKEKIEKLILFARTDPFQKLKIVEVLKEKGEVVAMTGDGVNDALALQKADIGIVVGEASEVAKETADMVLLDSNFRTIVTAVEEGRGIFDNLRKIILYLLSDAFGEILIIFGALLLGWPLPLLAGQILWINLVSDGFPALALTVDPKRKGLMRESPINPKENLLNFEIKALIVLVSFFAGLSTLLIFFWVWSKTADLAYARSLAFALLGANSLFYIFSCRSLREPVWRTNLLNNRWLLGAVIAGFLLLVSAFYFPPLVSLLRTTPLGIFEWGLILAAGLTVVLLIEATKFIFVLKSNQTR